jgi:hypothetical protein
MEAKRLSTQRRQMLDRVRQRILETTLETLRSDFEAHQQFGEGYGYRDAEEWWEVHRNWYPELFDGTYGEPLQKPDWVRPGAGVPEGAPDESEAVEFLRDYRGNFGFLIEMQQRVANGGRLTPRQIQAVLNCKRREEQHQERRRRERQNIDALTDGMYRTEDGTVYKVQYAVNGSGRLYAKRLVLQPDGGATFEYEPGAVFRLRPEQKMTLEEAREWGVLYGTCCVCGRTLTDEGSIEAGIGPVCAAKGWWR